MRSSSGLGPVEGAPPVDAEMSGSSRRQSTPSWSAMKSTLPKRKVWSGMKMGGAHILASGSMGNYSEPKLIISLEPAMLKMVERWAIQ